MSIAAESTCVVNKAILPADGVTTAVVTVTLINGAVPLVGKTVTLAHTNSAVVSAASGVSDANGVVTFTVKDATAENSVFTATDVTDASAVVTQTCNVTFYKQALAAQSATLTANTEKILSLESTGQDFKISHLGATDPIYFTLDGSTATKAGDNVFVVNAGRESSFKIGAGPVVLRIVSNGAVAFTVERHPSLH